MSSWAGTLPISEQDVRDYIGATSTTGAYATALIGSNIRAACGFLQRNTGRQFENQASLAKTFSSEGNAYVAIPGARSISAVTLQSAALVLNSSYWPIEDTFHSGIYIGIQLQAFDRRDGGSSYLSNPEWFDRDLDRLWERGYRGLPNDCVVTGDWGYTGATMPYEFLQAVKVLAAWYTKRPQAVLANIAVTAEGTALDYSALPPEVNEFITQWRLGSQVTVI